VPSVNICFTGVTAVSDVTLKKNISVYQMVLSIGRNNMSIENKLKNAKPTTWLTDGLSDTELAWIKFKTNIYLIQVRFILKIKRLLKHERPVS